MKKYKKYQVTFKAHGVGEKQTGIKMVTYSTEALTAILITVPLIVGRPTFKGLWDTQVALLKKLRKIKHPEPPLERMAGIMMTPAVYVLISTTPWAVPDQIREFFEVL